MAEFTAVRQTWRWHAIFESAVKTPRCSCLPPGWGCTFTCPAWSAMSVGSVTIFPKNFFLLVIIILTLLIDLIIIDNLLILLSVILSAIAPLPLLGMKNHLTHIARGIVAP